MQNCLKSMLATSVSVNLINFQLLSCFMAETVTIPKAEYEFMVSELETLRRTDLYKRFLHFVENIQKKKFTRADLGF